jgi:hypothetical protein
VRLNALGIRKWYTVFLIYFDDFRIGTRSTRRNPQDNKMTDDGPPRHRPLVENRLHRVGRDFGFSDSNPYLDTYSESATDEIFRVSFHLVSTRKKRGEQSVSFIDAFPSTFPLHIPQWEITNGLHTPGQLIHQVSKLRPVRNPYQDARCPSIRRFPSSSPVTGLYHPVSPSPLLSTPSPSPAQYSHRVLPKRSSRKESTCSLGTPKVFSCSLVLTS